MARHGEVEVGVGHDDGGGFAAEFERDFSDVIGGRVHDGYAAFDAAGERDHADFGVIGEGFADDGAGAGDEVEDAAPGGEDWATSFANSKALLGVSLLGLMTMVLPVTSLGAILRTMRKKGKFHERMPAVVADGHFVEQDVFAGAIALDDFAFVAAGELGHVVEVVGGEIDFDLGEREDLALLLSYYAGEVFAVGAEEGGDLAEVDGAADGGQRGPGFLGAFGGQCSTVNTSSTVPEGTSEMVSSVAGLMTGSILEDVTNSPSMSMS